MKKNRVSDAIRRQLTQILDRAGWGARAQVQRELGVSDQFLRRWEKGLVKIDLDKLDDVLRFLDVNPQQFFWKAFDLKSYSPEPTESRASAWVLRIRQKMTEQGAYDPDLPESTAEPPEWFEKLEGQRYTNPQQALENIGSLLRQASLSVESAAFLCAALGSTLRATCNYQEADDVFCEGILLSGNMPQLLLSLIHRRAVLYGAWGKIEEARQIAGEGLRLCLLQRDLPGVGKFLLSNANWYYNEGQLEDSKAAILAALEWLPKTENRYWLSATIALGLVERGLGNLERAAECIEDAAASASLYGAVFEWSIRWVKAEILSESRHFERAANEFQELSENYRDGGMELDALLACVEAVYNFVRGKRFRKAQLLASASVWMIAKFKGNKIAQGAVLDLVCSGTDASRLKVQQIKKIKEMIAEARMKAGAASNPGIEFTI